MGTGGMPDNDDWPVAAARYSKALTVITNPGIGPRRIINEPGKLNFREKPVVRNDSGKTALGQRRTDEFISGPVAVLPAPAVVEDDDGCLFVGLVSSVNI